MHHDRPMLAIPRVRAAIILTLMPIAAALAACSSEPVHVDAVARGSPLAPALDHSTSLPEAAAPVATGPSIIGYASWYRRGPNLARTCTGEPLSDGGLLAASPVLSVGTHARVTLLYSERSVIVRVDDCMPRGHRVIDLSEEAARELGLLQRGVALVRVTPVAWQ